MKHVEGKVKAKTGPHTSGGDSIKTYFLFRLSFSVFRFVSGIILILILLFILRLIRRRRNRKNQHADE